MANSIRAHVGIVRTATMLFQLLVVSFLSVISTPSIAQEGQSPLYEFRGPAAWIDVATLQYYTPDESIGVADGASILLFDRQINVTVEGDAQYEHFAVKVMNSVGVDAQSQVSISVDPTFQSLQIHWLRVVRDGEVIDQRELARISALPEESDFRNRIYNGRYNIDVLLADVRPGDIVEYAYTLSSRERLFPGHFAANLSTAWSSPLHRQRIRILSPLERPLRYRLSDSEIAPAAHVRGDLRELVLEWTDVAPITGDADRPGWYDPWPYLEVSDLQSWSDVSRLVYPLFSTGQMASARVADVVSEVRAGGGTLDQQALRALQYVQDRILYASIAIGRGTHEPADPDTVLERGFGDCKDKSLLLVTILDRLGIDAQTALVHSSKGRALDDALPTPYAFDHAIVRARIGDEVYWLDATAATRYSPLSTDDPPDYERALLVNPASDELHGIPRPASDTRRRELLMEFDLRDGIEKPATLEMTTWYRGRLADQMRPALLRGSHQQRESNYANYIASYYPGAKPAGSVTIEDDTAANVVEVREHYTLPRTFTRDEEDRLKFFLHVDELYRYGEALESSVREAPLALEYPIRARQNLVVHLPEEWKIEPGTVTVENPAFRYRSDVSYSGRTLKLDYEYEALADHVKLADLAQYQEDRKRFYDDTGYSLSYNAVVPEESTIAPVPIVAVVLALLLSIWGAVRWGYRYDPAPKDAVHGAPVGIRGWLLLPALGLVIGPFVFVWVIIAWAPFFAADMWQTVPTIVSDAWRSTAHAIVLGIVVMAVALLIANVLAIVLFFKKRTSASAAFIALSWTSVVYGGLVAGWAVLSGLDTETGTALLTGETVRESIATLLWTAYMLKSRRVKATFVRRAPPGELETRGALLTAA